jgi:hypothetical protein
MNVTHYMQRVGETGALIDKKYILQVGFRFCDQSERLPYSVGEGRRSIEHSHTPRTDGRNVAYIVAPSVELASTIDRSVLRFLRAQPPREGMVNSKSRILNKSGEKTACH